MPLISQFFRFLIFRHIFIGLCSLAIFQSTRIINQFPLELTAGSIFVSCSTILYYNFHQYSHRLNFASWALIKSSVRLLGLSTSEIILMTISLVAVCWSVIFISEEIFIIFVILLVISFFYSVPVLFWKGKKVRLRESLHFKLPVLAVTWAIMTAVLPLLEEHVTIVTTLMSGQVFMVALLVYALCIPFEMRDLDREKSQGFRSIPGVYGIKAAKWTAFFSLFIGILLQVLLFFKGHYSIYTLLALNVSFLSSMFVVLLSPKKPSNFYCKFYVDGMMILHFLFVFVSLSLP